MSINEEVKVLRNVPLFSRMDPSKLKLLAFASERAAFKADEVLFDEGDPADCAYIVIDGECEILVGTPQGPVCVAMLGRNEIIGEIAILIDIPRTATVRAKTDLVTLRISKDLFFKLVTEFPQMALEIMRELAHRLEKTTGQLRTAMSRAA